MASAFLATAGPAGWKLGRWSQISKTAWQEQKVDDPKVVHQFQVVNGPAVPGSNTIRLKMKDQSTEVLLLESTIQIFSNAGYMGEYLGQWQGGPPAKGGAAPAQSAAQSRKLAAAQPEPVASAGYAPGPAAQPARQAPPAAMPPSEKRAPVEQAGPQSKSLPPAAQRSRGGPSPDATLRPSEVGSSPLVQAGSMAIGAPPRPQKAQGLDKSPDKVQKLCDAAKNGDVAGVKQLLEAGVDPDGPAKNGTTPLMSAAQGGKLAVVEALLAAFADPNLGKGDETPLTIAFQKGSQDILKALFGASFSALGNMVNSSPLDISGYARENMNEVPDNAADDLRNVTMRLSKVNKQREDSPTGRDKSPQRFGQTYETLEEEDQANPKGAVLRTQNVRMTMQSLAKAKGRS